MLVLICVASLYSPCIVPKFAKEKKSCLGMYGTFCFFVIRSYGDQSVCVGRTQTVLLLLYDPFFSIHPGRFSHQSFWFCSFILTISSLPCTVFLHFSEELLNVINTMFLFCFCACQDHNWVTFVAVKKSISYYVSGRLLHIM